MNPIKSKKKFSTFRCLNFMKESFDLESNLKTIFGDKSQPGRIPYYSPFEKPFITISGYAYCNYDLFSNY